MRKQYRILAIRQGNLNAQPLDAALPVQLKIASTKRYIENEIIKVSIENDTSLAPNTFKVKFESSTIDPSYIDEKPPVLTEMMQGVYCFDEGKHCADMELFHDALEYYDAGDYMVAGKKIRALIHKYPLFIDAYHHLGNIECELRNLSSAIKYYEMGYRIGRLTVPADFNAKLPWNELENRPFLRTSHAYALLLEKQKRYLEASEIYEQILLFNPDDNQGIRFILPNLYIKAKAPAKAKEVLGKHGADGMNLFTRFLIALNECDVVDALRWLFRGVNYNLYFPSLALANKLFPLDPDRDTHLGIVVGSKEEAITYLQEMCEFRKNSKVINFLEKILFHQALRDRIQRAKEFDILLEAMPPSKQRSNTIKERYNIFDENNLPEFLEECHDIWE